VAALWVPTVAALGVPMVAAPYRLDLSSAPVPTGHRINPCFQPP
jgi:hypothetical protein